MASMTGGVDYIKLVATSGMLVTPCELRPHPRHRTFLAGRIVAEGSDAVLCVVRDMSKTGARLVIHAEAELAEQVQLHLVSRGEIFHGRIVWRKGDLAGMHFSSWERV